MFKLSQCVNVYLIFPEVLEDKKQRHNKPCVTLDILLLIKLLIFIVDELLTYNYS